MQDKRWKRPKNRRRPKMPECEVEINCSTCDKCMGYSEEDHSLEQYQCEKCAEKEDNEE